MYNKSRATSIQYISADYPRLGVTGDFVFLLLSSILIRTTLPKVLAKLSTGMFSTLLVAAPQHKVKHRVLCICFEEKHSATTPELVWNNLEHSESEIQYDTKVLSFLPGWISCAP